MYCKNCGEALYENQSICLKCGAMSGHGDSFCHNCGNAVAKEAVICVKCGVPTKKESNINTEGIRSRSIVRAIILSIVTCGIYAIYWFAALTNEMNQASGRAYDTSGLVAFLLNLITFGIYGYFWAYNLGEKRDIIANEKSSTNALYLILMFLGLGIIVYGLAQDALNKAIKND